MRDLKQFDCICLRMRGSSQSSADQIQRVLPQVTFVGQAKKPEVMSALKKMQGAFVLVLPCFVIPQKTLASVVPDPLLLNAGYQLRWLARNAITGELSDENCPQLWRRADFILHREALELGHRLPVSKVIVMPEVQAGWDFNTSSRAAFSAGMVYAKTLQNSGLAKSTLTKKLQVAAMVGQDAEYADWWQLGVLRGILGGHDVHKAYQSEKDITAKSGTMNVRIQDLMRDVRVLNGIPITRLSAEKSQFFKQNKFGMPARIYYDAVADAYWELDAAGLVLSNRFSEAADWVWSAKSP